MRTELAERFGVRYPIFAFSYEPAVVAAVTKAGGFGVLGALRFTPEELEEALTWIEREVGEAPYGLDIVMPASSAALEGRSRDALQAEIDKLIPDEHKRFVDKVLDDHGVPPLRSDGPEVRGLLGWTDATARPQLEVAFAHPIKLLANALGPPPADVVDEAHEHGIPVAALVGSREQAERQRDAGVDIVVAQGTEAGGHTGEVATMVLTPEVVDAVAPTPVLAAGGIGRGRQVAAALALGAQGAWTGSVWLNTAECPQPDVLRRNLEKATSRDTVRSRSMTGKPARQLRTAWTEAWEGPESPGTLPMPLQYFLTAEAQQRIRQSEDPELIGIPVGQIVGSMGAVRSVADVIADMVTEYDESIERLGKAELA